MGKASFGVIFLTLGGVAFATPASSQEIKIVAWNMGASLLERVENRQSNLEKLARELKPDILVLIEVVGLAEAQSIARSLGWQRYFGVVSDFSTASTEAFQGLEVAVISQIEITGAVEFDTSPEARGGFHEAFTEQGLLPGRVKHEKLSSVGISGIYPLGPDDRGTIRVDLTNGLSIFPVHLKSNRNSFCGALDQAIESFERLKIDVPTQLQMMKKNGFDLATQDHVDNARKRERVMGAVVKLADKALAEGRVPVIAGDFNTGFEPGKAGSEFKDCVLQNFSCETGPFPEHACRDGDGFDDTLAILENGLIGEAKWAILSKDLPRTYSGNEKPAFANQAIDHIAVPLQFHGRFTVAERGDDKLGSDHFPVFTRYRAQP